MGRKESNQIKQTNKPHEHLIVNCYKSLFRELKFLFYFCRINFKEFLKIPTTRCYQQNILILFLKKDIYFLLTIHGRNLFIYYLFNHFSSGQEKLKMRVRSFHPKIMKIYQNVCRLVSKARYQQKYCNMFETLINSFNMHCSVNRYND